MNTAPNLAIEKHSNRKNDRLAVRLPSEVKDMLELAAEVSGRSLSDFVLASAVTAAHKSIENHERMRLSNEDRAVFLAAFSDDAEPNEALKNAASGFMNRQG
jgi:uncharacterized protein (DUF1778 family)